MSIFTGKRIILAVSGSIAAYKAAEVASKLTQAGALVDVILTPAGEKFVSALTFQSVTGRKAFSDGDLWGGEAHVLHVGLGQQADLLVVAPATANTLASLAHGIADNLVTITGLAARCPILVAPAMDAGMYSQPAVQENIRILQARGVHFAGPVEGRMASGLVGLGRFIDPLDLIGHIRLLLGHNGKLAGRLIVVTAGGTEEAIDPVRMLTNRSSGRQGYALAQASIDLGASVTLISTPVALNAPVGSNLVSIRTAQEMHEAVIKECARVDVLVMAAAVADFRPKKRAKDKIKKQAGLASLELEKTTDILLSVAAMGADRPRIVVGFAAESRDLLINATQKLEVKHLDLIAANDISSPDSGFEVGTNRLTLIYADGRQEPLPLMTKDEAAEILMERITSMLEPS